MYGFDVQSLKLLNGNKTSSLWEAIGSQLPYWIHVQKRFGPRADLTYLQMVGTTGAGPRGDIAVDDISFEPGACSNNPQHCDFEMGKCGFANEDADTADWLLVRADHQSLNGPGKDHTYHSGSGHYMVSNCSEDTFAQLISRSYPKATSYIQYWYNYQTSLDTVLNIYRRPGEGTEVEQPPLDTISHVTGPGWQLGQVTVGGGSTSFQLVFEVQCATKYDSVALDDVGVTTKPAFFNCDFEGACLWTNSDIDDIDWVLGMGEIADEYGPDSDHTLGTSSGKYLLIENGFNRNKTMIAAYSSPLLDVKSGCLSFWTYSLAENIKVMLAAYDKLEGSDNVIWESNLDNQNWIQRTVDIPGKFNFSVSYQLAFLAELLPTESQERTRQVDTFALDDIRLQGGQCSEHSTAAPDQCALKCVLSNEPSEPEKCISASQVCDFVSDCVDGSDEVGCPYNCNFEDTTKDNKECLYMSDIESAWIWKYETAGDNASYGPPLDHSLGQSGAKGGHYFSLEYNTIEGSAPNAQLISPRFPHSYMSCKLNFWYYLNATHSDKELLEAFHVDSEGFEVSLSQWSKFKYNGWDQQTALIGRNIRPFYIKFSGHLPGSGGSVTVDDITLDDCAPPPKSSSESCDSKTHFLCANNVCVHQNLLCDFNDDCGDNSDEMDSNANAVTTAKCEKYPGRCSMELGHTCAWSPMSLDTREQWNLESGRVRDHTTNLQTGLYLALSERLQNQSRIVSPAVYYEPGAFTPSGGEDLPCLLRFHFFTDVKHLANLKVYSREYVGGPLTRVWRHDGTSGWWWERVEIPVAATINNPVEYIIEATSDTSNKVDDIVAIDDVSFSGSCSLLGSALPPWDKTTTVPANPCRDDEFRCMNDQCVISSSICDFTPDCQDGSDEFDCAECTFKPDPHVGSCGWEDQSVGRWGWQFQELDGVTAMVVVGKEGEVSDTADIETPGLGQTAAACMVTLSYMKDGGGQGKTILRMRLYNANSTEGEVIWTQKNQMGHKWESQDVAIGARDANWRLAMEGVKNEDVGTLAFKLMHFTNCSLPKPGECGEGERQCRNGVCVRKEQFCDFSNDCGDWSDEGDCDYLGGCSFEEDICQFSQDTTDEFDWERRAGGTDDEGVAPGEDHTYGNSTGYYMYVPPSEEGTNSKAVLLGPSFLPSGGSCNFRMWFHMHGGGVTELAVYLRKEGGGEDTQLWTKDEESEYAWLLATMPVPTSQETWRIAIEAIRSMGPEGDVAIDDLTFSDSCSLGGNTTTSTSTPTMSPTTPGVCSDQQFQCGDLQCIPKEQICDFRPQCHDASDEQGCIASCSFDKGSSGDICFWKERKPDKLDWILARRNNSQDGTDQHGPYGPSSVKDFVFLHPDQETSDFSLEDATLESPAWQNSVASCQLNFWLYLTGDLGKKLEVVLEDELALEDTVLAYLDNTVEEAEQWNEQKISLGNHKGRFKVGCFLLQKNQT